MTRLTSTRFARFVRSCLLPAGLALFGPLAGAAAQDAGQGVPYETDIEGLEDSRVESLLLQTSQLITRQDDAPATVAGLRRRARDDRQRLLQALRSEGFYDASLSIDVNAETRPADVTITVQPGPVYLLAEANVVYTPAIPPDVEVPRDVSDFDNLEAGMRARAPRVVSAQSALLTTLRNKGYPAARVGKREAVVDHDKRTLNATWRVDPGERVIFGEWTLTGLDSVEADYLRQFREWKPGETYDQRKIAATRRALMKTDLFAGIEVTRGTPNDGRQPVTFNFTEREHRSLGFTGRFSTTEGPAGSAFWEHRNAFGENETGRVQLDLGLITQQVEGTVAKPRFWQANQTLQGGVTLRRQDSEAFLERTFASELGLERRFSGVWTGALGGSFETTVTRDNEGERTFALVGVPGRIQRDTRNDTLNPTKGSLVGFYSTPYFVTVEETHSFLRNELRASAYLALDTAERIVLAGRSRIGSIAGPATGTIPASKRFYAGGGGSIRGYNIQEAGPLDDSGDPLGGRSAAEASFELRWRVTESIGLVPFLDAGNVYDDPLPVVSNESGDLFRYGTGLGFRYFTGIGPLRVDVARALDRRDVDDAFELYISFGQAF